MQRSVKFKRMPSRLFPSIFIEFEAATCFTYKHFSVVAFAGVDVKLSSNTGRPMK